jgi:hypothetical protein
MMHASVSAPSGESTDDLLAVASNDVVCERQSVQDSAPRRHPRSRSNSAVTARAVVSL